ncbi:MAG: hypothetical protein L6R48_24820 [Planctomycetes bacterium]|nr:hypothetical protein [Planctomycetota bacterium]
MRPPPSSTSPCDAAHPGRAIVAAPRPVCDGCGGARSAGPWRAGADGIQLCTACWRSALAGSGR